MVKNSGCFIGSSCAGLAALREAGFPEARREGGGVGMQDDGRGPEIKPSGYFLARTLRPEKQLTTITYCITILAYTTSVEVF